VSKLRFSLICPAFNEEKNIGPLLLNLLSLNFDKSTYEIIIQDDCSTDTTYGIAKNYEKTFPQIKVFKNSKNLGIAKNRNAGALNASGEIMVHLDADAWYPPNTLQIIDDDFKKFNLVALSGILMPRTNENPTMLDYFIFLGISPVWQFIGGTGNLFCVKSKVFKELGGFREPGGVKGREDLDLWYRIENSYKEKMLIDNLLIVYVSLRRVKQSKSNNFLDIINDYIRMANGYWLDKGYGRVD
jgi:glycosyltransferase involved in cell wall biosynthesis